MRLNRHMDKKGLAENIVFWLPRLIFLAIVIVVLIALVRNVVVMYEDTSYARVQVYLNKMLYDGNGIIRYENDRAYPGVIDYSKFNDANLDKILVSDTNTESPSAKLYLKSVDPRYYFGSGDERSINTENLAEIQKEMFKKPEIEKTIYWNQKWYERLEPKGFFRGSGAPRFYIYTINVLLYKDSKLVPAELQVALLVPK